MQVHVGMFKAMLLKRNASPHAIAAILGVLAVSGCSGEPSAPTATATPPPQAVQAAMPPLSAEEQARISAHYLCGLHQVVILGHSDARIALNTGTQVRAGVIANSMPPTFTADGLTLVESRPGSAELSDENGESQSCTAVSTDSMAEAAPQ